MRGTNKKESVSVRLSEEQAEYLKKRVNQGYSKNGYIVMLLEEDMQRSAQAHSTVMESMCKIENMLQSIKRRINSDYSIGVKEVERIEMEVNKIWEKL